MTEEYNFKNLCDLTTSVLGLPKGSLALKSRKRPLQVARAIAGYIARSEEDIHRAVIGNGLNRDTYVETNIQDNSVDGRKDQIITECGLEIMLPETHALIKFS